jgi:glucokinase
LRQAFTMTSSFPRLVGDVGGTNARFGWQSQPDGPITDIHILPCAEHATIEAAIRAYLQLAGKPVPAACAFGIANPVTGDQVRMTNHHWAFSIAQLQHDLGLGQLKVINDFTALALSLPDIPQAHLVQISGGQAQANAPMALLGAGTGLGVSGLVPAGPPGKWLPLAGEGGHITLAAQTLQEYQLIELIRQRYGHVSAERVLSGQGLVDLYLALRQLHGLPAQEVTGAAEISNWALRDQDPVAREALNLFAGWLGSVAGDLVLTLGARGGVYLGGGIVPRWLGWFEHSAFKARFTAKGRFAAYLHDVPVWVINAPDSPALWGAARALAL